MNPSTPIPPAEDPLCDVHEASTETASTGADVSMPEIASQTVSILSAGGRREGRPPESVRPHDFRQSGFLAPSELRRIRQRHEQFVRALAARLAILLRVEFNIQLGKLQIVGYQKFSESLPSPTHITLFKVDPLKGAGMLVISPRFGLAMVDRLLGGPGNVPETNRDLSEIEVALVDQVATLVLTEWSNHWPEMRDLRPALLGHETNSRFLQTSSPDTAMLLLTLTAGFGEQSGSIEFAIPYATVEPLVRLLAPAGIPDADNTVARAPKIKWNPELDEVPVPVVAEWHGINMSAGAITRLKTGDVLMLDPHSAAQVQLRLGRVPRFVGRPGTRGGKWAIELTAALPD